MKVGPVIYPGAATTSTGADGFSGLTGSTTYTCSVIAFNGAGPSKPGVSNAMTTMASAPSPPPPRPPVTVTASWSVVRCSGDCEVIIACGNNACVVSSDYGFSWTTQSLPSKRWVAADADYDGQVMGVVEDYVIASNVYNNIYGTENEGQLEILCVGQLL